MNIAPELSGSAQPKPAPLPQTPSSPEAQPEEVQAFCLPPRVQQELEERPSRTILTPREIERELRRNVVGNEDAVGQIAVAVHNHLKRSGQQISVDQAERALGKVFALPAEKQSGFDNLVRALTLALRKSTLDKPSAATRSDIRQLIKLGQEAGLLGRLKTQRKPKKEKAAVRGKKTGRSKAKPVAEKRLIESLKQVRRCRRRDERTLRIPKENILIIGPTGSGKTEISRQVARLLDVPFVHFDATGLTEAGYRGEDAASIPQLLLEAAHGNKARAEQGIVFVDEIDKKRLAPDSHSSRDISGRGAQEALLRLLEDHVDHETGLDMSRVLFILAGTFGGLEMYIGRRTGLAPFGLQPSAVRAIDPAALMAAAQPEDLQDYGLIPELVGRFTKIVTTQPVDRDLMLRILTEPRDSVLSGVRRLLREDGVTLRFTDEGLEEIVKAAIKLNTGARALRIVVDRVTYNTQRDAPELKHEGPRVVVVNADYVRRQLEQFAGQREAVLNKARSAAQDPAKEGTAGGAP